MYKFDYNYFANVLGMSESSNNYTAQNGIAYGRYQFIKSTFERIVNELGLTFVSVEDFLNSPSLQDRIFKYYVDEIINFIITSAKLTTFLGKKITGRSNGIKTEINLYGLVAGAWLGGKSGLENYLIYDKDKSDAYGTFISDYIAKFSFDFNKKKDS